MKNLKILTIGGATQDITFSTDSVVLKNNPQDLTRQKLMSFEFGAKINIDSVNFNFGGGASNTAINFANLNNSVSTLICLGEDSIGQAILKNLKNNKINTSLIQFSENTSGLSFVINAKNLTNEHTLFTHRGSNEELKIDLDILEKKKFDLIYLASLSGKKHSTTLLKIFKYKNKSLKNKIAWNPGNLQIKLGIKNLKPYLLQTDILILNKDESIEICMEVDYNKNTLNNPRELLKILAEYCKGTIVITNGHNGAYCISENKIYYEPSCRVKAKDTTGVGDAFGSTFAWALLKTNFNIQKSLQLAIKNACSVLQNVGAQHGFISLPLLFKEGDRGWLNTRR